MKNASEYSKARRKRLKEQGYCTVCGKVPKSANSQLCGGCSRKRKTATKLWKTKNKDHWLFLKNKSSRKCRRDARLKIIEEYGGRCSCCGEDEEKFLQVDHIDKDGHIHRKITWSINQDLLKNKGKYRVRILCANCHNAITYYGSCPHEKCTIPASPKGSYTAD